MSSAHQQPFAFPQAQPLLCQERGSASQDRLCPKIGGSGRNALMGQLERQRWAALASPPSPTSPLHSHLPWAVLCLGTVASPAWTALPHLANSYPPI